MDTTRRQLLAAGAASAGAYIFSVNAAPSSELGINAARFGVHPGRNDDQSRVLQLAIDRAAEAHVPLRLAPGDYRAGDLILPPGAHLAGTPGETRITMLQGQFLVSAQRADGVTLSGLVLDGGGVALSKNRGLVHILSGKALRIVDCRIIGAGGNAIALEGQDWFR
jgi:uncharacterized secreted repeat protein (TIGR03808 family)